MLPFKLTFTRIKQCLPKTQRVNVMITLIALFMSCSASAVTLPTDFAGTLQIPVPIITAPNHFGSTDANGTYNPYSMRAYLANNNGVNGYLLQYHLTQPSNLNSEQYINSEPYSSSNTAISGDLWMFVANSYQLTGDNTAAHSIEVYFDQLSRPYDLQDATSRTFNFTDTALLTGSGSFDIYCCEYDGQPTPQNSMNTDIWTCLADGCYASALLNLLYADYTAVGNIAMLQINTNPDTNGLVYQQTDGYWESGMSTLNLAVNPIPIPGAAWLFASALLGLAGFKRNRVSL